MNQGIVSQNEKEVPVPFSKQNIQHGMTSIHGSIQRLGFGTSMHLPPARQTSTCPQPLSLLRISWSNLLSRRNFLNSWTLSCKGQPATFFDNVLHVSKWSKCCGSVWHLKLCPFDCSFWLEHSCIHESQINYIHLKSWHQVQTMWLDRN